MSRAALVLSVIAAVVAATSSHAATSHFSTDSEGWIAAGDSEGPLVWVASGGNPGGHVLIDDLTTGGVTYFVAPPKFLGDRSVALGSNLSFDLQQVYTGTPSQFDSADVLLYGAGLTLAYDTAVNPANGAWTSYAVPLTAAGWRLNSLAGAAASDVQFAAVLSDLTGLRIRAEYRTGPDIGKLDNVSLVPEPAAGALLVAGLGAVLLAVRRRAARNA